MQQKSYHQRHLSISGLYGSIKGKILMICIKTANALATANVTSNKEGYIHTLMCAQ